MLPDAPPPPRTECSGCIEDDECVRGDEDERCGSEGDACVACETGESCTEDGRCVAPTGCSPENCDGCCDASGSCVDGNAADACGAAGAACSTCQEGIECVDGACDAGCSPETCAGCCDSAGTCVGGNDVDACGRGGLACNDCGEDGVCDSGICATQSCADTCAGCCDGETCVETSSAAQCGQMGAACVACTGEQSCQEGMCVEPSGTLWSVELVSADPGPFDWDLLSPPDPYVFFAFLDADGDVVWTSSSVRSDTSFPVWNEVLVTNVPAELLEAGMLFELWDRDAFDDDHICDFYIEADASHFSATLNESICSWDSQIRLRWRLTPVQ